MPSGAAFFVGFPWTYYSFHYIDPEGGENRPTRSMARMVSKPSVYAVEEDGAP
jgi:hypothetical protein